MLPSRAARTPTEAQVASKNGTGSTNRWRSLPPVDGRPKFWSYARKMAMCLNSEMRASNSHQVATSAVPSTTGGNGCRAALE